jgi:prolyl-tRNA editing enzyme YbaK/EbsC (Cys-tRNA(Pro) deacylase)
MQGGKGLKAYPPPGPTLQSFELAHEVISCSEASSAKGIPLANELKTLILKTSVGYYALHLPGGSRASYRKVKRFLSVDEAFLLSPSELNGIGLLSGTVSPVFEPVWSMSHLISSSVLELQFVSTNNGTRTRYVTFSPGLLLDARDVSVGDFEG